MRLSLRGLRVEQALDDLNRGSRIERLGTQSRKLLSVTSDLEGLLFVVVSRKTLQVDNIQMGGLPEPQNRCWAAQELMFAGVEGQDLQHYVR